MNTIITEKTEQGEVSYDVFSKLVHDRILFICGGIDDQIATDMVATLLYLDNIDNNKKISLYINSPGGDIRSVFMIYDIMSMVESPLETFCIGSAINESALILAAGTKGMRYATKNAIIGINQLMHYGSQHSDISNAQITFEQLKNDNKKLLESYSKSFKKPLKLVTKDTERQVFFKTYEAKKYGIIDHIVEGSK